MSQIIVASDICLFRQGLSAILSTDGRLGIAGRASSGKELLRLIDKIVPELVLLDMGMDKAMITARVTSKRWPSIKIIALCVSECAEEIMQCAEVGVAGFVSRDGTVEDLVATVASAERGELACSARIAGFLLKGINTMTVDSDSYSVIDKLTPREMQVAGLVSEGLTNKQIANQLNISISTTKNHVHHLLEKLGASHRAQAAAVFRRMIDNGCLAV